MVVKLKYTGPALPGESEEIDLFDSSVAFNGANYLQMHCLKRLLVAVKNDQTGTLNLHKSSDRGETWSQVGTETVAAAAAAGENQYDFLIEAYSDIRLEWVNGEDAQTTFAIDMVLTDERGAAVPAA